MRRSGQLLIIFGLVLAVIAAGVTFFVLRSPAKQATTTPTKMASVVVAFQSMDAHVPVPPDAIGVKQWPADSVPPGAIQNPAEATGKLTRSPIFPGQIILSAMLVDKKAEEARKGLGSDASFIVPAGKVAVAMSVDQISGVAGAVQAGDRVDIMVTMQLQEDTPTGQQAKPATQFTLQDVEVLRIGPWNITNQKQNQGGGLITFLVEPQQALILKNLRENTLVDLALRAAGDHTEYKTDTVTQDYLIKEFNLRLR